MLPSGSVGGPLNWQTLKSTVLAAVMKHASTWFSCIALFIEAVHTLPSATPLMIIPPLSTHPGTESGAPRLMVKVALVSRSDDGVGVGAGVLAGV